jgi:hypothetical protein
VTEPITDHHINVCNDHIAIVRHQNGEVYVLGPPSGKLTRLFFQAGPVSENGEGINGITNEALLAVVLDRLRGFQETPYACRENYLAIEKIKEALDCLQSRTARRVKAGVEGTSQVDTKHEGLRPPKEEYKPISEQTDFNASRGVVEPKWPGQMAVPPSEPRNEDLEDVDTEPPQKLEPLPPSFNLEKQPAGKRMVERMKKGKE